MSHFLCTSFFILFALAIPCISHAQVPDSTGIDLIKERIREYLSQDSPEPDKVEQMIQAMEPDGSWPDIDYTSVQVANWPAIAHLRRYVIPLTKAYANPGSRWYHDHSLLEVLHLSLGYWLDHNFTSRNWWYNDIGVPMDLTDILIMMDDEISLEEFLRATNQMRGSYVMQKGQNKVWRAEIRFKIGLIQYGRGRGNLLGPPVRKIPDMVEVLKSEIVVREKEGIQTDWSFHQHGVQQQFGNYGLSYASTQAKWAYFLKGTPYEYSGEQISILRNYFIHGLSRVIWKGRMGISGLGRQIRPGNQEERANIVLDVLRLMKKADPSFIDQYQAVIDFNTDRHSAKPVPIGNYYFWRSAMMTHRTDNYNVSVRMCSRKIQSTESGNGENLLAAHLSDGATYLYKTAAEYKNIFPVWDWHRIPGTTAYATGDLPEVGWGGLHNDADFVGGLSDTKYGIATMLFRRNGLKVHKSWFFVPDGMVCLGSGITSLENETVATTLNQSLLKGSVIVGHNGKVKTLESGQNAQDNDVEWVYHDGMGYIFLQNEGNVVVDATSKTGNWQRIYENGTHDMRHKDVFDLWIHHGIAPQNGSYAYMVLPVMDGKDQLIIKSKNPDLQVLQNTSSAQAIHDTQNDIMQVVFYQAGQVSIDDTTSITVDTPCILMMQRVESGMKVTVSVPPELPNQVNLTLSGQYSGEHVNFDPDKKETSVLFDLPEGLYAGKSVTKILMR